MAASFQPAVVGSPRSGFTLLCSVLHHFSQLRPPKWNLRQTLLNQLIDHLGNYPAVAVLATVDRLGLSDRLVYNTNFRDMLGGPKWLSPDSERHAEYRKYIGIRGLGDFTLIIRHPVETLDRFEVVHSHAAPRAWVESDFFGKHSKYASVRNPAGIVNSSMFSLNALASEYIQRFLHPEQDNDALRQNLALYKFTNLDFFQGLVRFYSAWFEEFLAVRDQYHVMRWEDLILEPSATIISLAAATGIELTHDHAEQIWARIGHRNLTNAHQHNFRKGFGVVGNWRHWMTNRHLEILRDHGLEAVGQELGYGPFEPIDEAAYTPFQQRIDDNIRRGDVYNDYEDKDLFEFAFNKSNIISDRFPFKRYDWRTETRVERSSFRDEGVLQEIWDEVEGAVIQLNRLLDTFLDSNGESADVLRLALKNARAAAPKIVADMPAAVDAAFDKCHQLLQMADRGDEMAEISSDLRPPQLIVSFEDCNLVGYEGKYYGVPHAAGPLDLRKSDLTSIDGLIVESTFESAKTRIEVRREASVEAQMN